MRFHIQNEESCKTTVNAIMKWPLLKEINKRPPELRFRCIDEDNTIDDFMSQIISGYEKRIEFFEKIIKLIGEYIQHLKPIFLSML